MLIVCKKRLLGVQNTGVPEVAKDSCGGTVVNGLALGLAGGAIFGLYGILLSLIVSKHFDPATSKVFLVLLAFTAGYSLLMGFLSEGIDNSAHVGGLIAGFSMGLFYAKTIKEAVGTSDIRTRVRKSNKDFIEQD